MRLLFIFAAILAVPSTVFAANPTLESVAHGKYYRYFPPNVKPTSPVLIVVHGSLAADDSGEEAALAFLKTWLGFANQTGTALISPAFSDRDYGSGPACPHGWGYRGLYGRHVGADDFLHEILDQLKGVNEKFDGKVFLFGHSAGAQFVSHYVVMHPERVNAAVISAPAWLPFPTMDDNWPRGLKPRKSVRRWPGESEDQTIEMIPDPTKFLEAAQLPLLATSGALDLEPIRHSPSQGGDTHVARVQSWAKAMNEFAAEKGKTGTVRCNIVQNVGHDFVHMSRSCVPFLVEEMNKVAIQKKRDRLRGRKTRR